MRDDDLCCGPDAARDDDPGGIPFDTDGDGVVDQVGQDTTGEGVVDTWAIDTNEDGVSDQVAIDTVGDGQAHQWVVDRDENGIPEQVIDAGSASASTDIFEQALTPAPPPGPDVFDQALTPAPGAGADIFEQGLAPSPTTPEGAGIDDLLAEVGARWDTPSDDVTADDVLRQQMADEESRDMLSSIEAHQDAAIQNLTAPDGITVDVDSNDEIEYHDLEGDTNDELVGGYDDSGAFDLDSD